MQTSERKLGKLDGLLLTYSRSCLHTENEFQVQKFRCEKDLWLSKSWKVLCGVFLNHPRMAVEADV